MENIAPQALIGASPLFRNLRPRESEAIIARLQPAHYAAGEPILKRGAWHGRLYILASGEVEVLLLHEDTPPLEAEAVGTEPSSYVVAVLGPGECFGEMSLLTGEPPTATIRATRESALWSLSQADFLELSASCPTLLQNMTTILSQRLARTNQRILARPRARRSWLALASSPDDLTGSALLLSIADALAWQGQRRVLLLLAGPREDVPLERFARAPQHLRPSLNACAHDAGQFEVHKAPTVTDEGRHYAALCSLEWPEGELSDGALREAFSSLAALYDDLLFATTGGTPVALLQFVAEACRANETEIDVSSSDPTRRVILLLPASRTPPQPLLETYKQADLSPSLIVTEVPDRATIGVQDVYEARLGLPVKRLLPADPALLEESLVKGLPLRDLAPDAPLTLGVNFVARFIAHQTVGIAFGGGGARGFAHLGILERLVQHRVPLDYIASCSSGIIAPGMYLIGKSFAESEQIFLQIQDQVAKWRIPRTSIFSNRGLKRLLRSNCGELRFEDLTTPFAMVAIDLATRSGVVLDRGPLWLAGLASVALPGIFPPVLVGEHILMDAGFHDPVPIRVARQMGADILLASELGEQEPPRLTKAAPWLEQAEREHRPAPRSPHIVDLLLRSYDLAMATIGMHSIREADVVLRPRLHRVSLRQFSEGRKFVAAGREVVEESLPRLREFLPWL